MWVDQEKDGHIPHEDGKGPEWLIPCWWWWWWKRPNFTTRVEILRTKDAAMQRFTSLYQHESTYIHTTTHIPPCSLAGNTKAMNSSQCRSSNKCTVLYFWTLSVFWRCYRPRVFQEVECPRFKDNRYMKVVRLSALRTGGLYPPPPGNIPGTRFYYRLSQPQGHSAAGRVMSIKNSNDTTGNRTRDLPACSAVPQPTAPPRAPYW